MHSGVCTEKPGVMQSIHLHLYRDPCRLRDTRRWQTHGTVCGPRNSKLREKKKEQRVLQEQLMAQYCELFCLTSLWRPFNHKICFFKKKTFAFTKKYRQSKFQTNSYEIEGDTKRNVLVHCHKQMQADKQTEMHVYTHTHTHSKNVSAALGSLQAVGVDTNCIIVSHWNGIRLYQSVTQRDTADMTSDAAIKSAIVAFTFGLCRWSGGGGSKNVDICDSWRASWLPLRLSLSVPNSIFLLHCLKFFILSSLSILTQSVCFAHCQAACLLMCTTALSHYHICVVLSVILPAKPHSCQTIWQALVKQEKLVCCRPRNSRGFDWKAVVSFCWAN